jgi:hypothetical protein
MVLGVPFQIASIEIRRARDISRAVRAAELRLARRTGVDDWHERADTVEAISGP